jgi:hypothetical protein
MPKLPETYSGIPVVRWDHPAVNAPEVPAVGGFGATNLTRRNLMTFDAAMAAEGLSARELLRAVTVDQLESCRALNMHPALFFIPEPDSARRRWLVERLNARHTRERQLHAEMLERREPAPAKPGLLESLRQFGWDDALLLDLLVAHERRGR